MTKELPTQRVEVSFVGVPPARQIERASGVSEVEVDGPILRWAIEERRGREPVVWVTDGQVTDSNDHPDETLSEECARLVLSNQIRMVRELTEVARVFSNRTSSSSGRANFGRVGRKMQEIRASGHPSEN